MRRAGDSEKHSISERSGWPRPTDVRIEFLAMLAHEPRNPLAAIRGALEVLRLGSADSAEAVKTWGIVDRQARQMVRLTDDLLAAIPAQPIL